MLAPLAHVCADSSDLPIHGPADVDRVISVIPHDQPQLANAMRAQPASDLLRMVKRAWRPEVCCVEDRVSDGAMIRVELVVRIPWRAHEGIMGEHEIGLLGPDEPGRGRRELWSPE